MKVSIGNKRLNDKPVSQKEKGFYFKDLKFKTGNFKTCDFEHIVGNGYTITYLFRDSEFDRSNNYMSKNYLGTQFICVDVDGCDIHPTDFVESIRYKPSVIHTTFSNLTERKNNKYCYHLLYFFDDIIYGEDNFNLVFNMLSDDYDSFVDQNCKDCHRVIFTSNSDFSNYVYEDFGLTYKVEDFIYNDNVNERYDDIDDFFNKSNESSSWEKMSSLNKSYISPINLLSETIISQDKYEENSPKENMFNLDEGFHNDLYSMKRGEFIEKYSMIYPYFRETQIDESRFVNGYVDLRNEEYYDVPTSRWRWDTKNNRPYIPKVEKGNRNKMLWIDTCCLMKIQPDITKEHLVYLLISEVYRNFDNSDGEMTNWFIITKLKEVWDNLDKIKVRPLKKSFKIDKDYWLERGYTKDDWLSVIQIVMKEMKCNDIGGLYDLSLTVEQNLDMLKHYGVRTTKRTLIKWLEEIGQPVITDKQVRNNMVLDMYKQDTSRSSREIERLCLEKGVKVSYRTVQNIISDFMDTCVD